VWVVMAPVSLVFRVGAFLRVDLYFFLSRAVVGRLVSAGAGCCVGTSRPGSDAADFVFDRYENRGATHCVWLGRVT